MRFAPSSLTPTRIIVSLIVTVGLCTRSTPAADPTELTIEDPFATVDGDPVTIAHLNLLINQRFGPKVVTAATPQLRQAAALMLVRQQLAFRSLTKSDAGAQRIGTAAVADAIARAKRRGTSLTDIAAAASANVRAIEADVRFKAVWQDYLSRNLSEENLRRFFNSNPKPYGVDAFDELTDLRRIKSDATAKMFAVLVQRSRDAQVQWIDETLRPPAGVNLFEP